MSAGTLQESAPLPGADSSPSAGSDPASTVPADNAVSLDAPAGTDARAFVERLVAAHADLVLRVAYARLGSLADAQDACQDVFLKLLALARKGLAQFNDAEHEKAWIIRTTINACIDLRRRENSHQVVTLDESADHWNKGDMGYPDVGREGIPDGIFDDDTRAVLDAVNTLPPIYRQAVYLRYYEGYSVKEIATLTDETPGTVRKHLSRAYARLRPLLKGGAR